MQDMGIYIPCSTQIEIPYLPDGRSLKIYKLHPELCSLEIKSRLPGLLVCWFLSQHVNE
jgi:hypothetical protein